MSMTMTINMNIIFLMIYFFQIIADLVFNETTKKCISNNPLYKDKIKIILIIVLHHLYSTFLIYGWILSSKWMLLLYIIINIITFISWYFNNGLCRITVLQNQLCNWKITKSFNNICSFIHNNIIVKLFNGNETDYTYLYIYEIITSYIAIYKILY